MLLAHLDETHATTAGNLARPLDVAASTLSRTPAPSDRGRTELRLIPHGAEAMADTSVLDRRPIAAVLEQLSPRGQTGAVAGLAQLARAALAFQLRSSRRRRRRQRRPTFVRMHESD